MLRAWFILIIGVGLLSSAMSSCSRQVETAGSSSGFTTLNESRIAHPRTRLVNADSGDADATSSDALVLEREYDGHFYADVLINGASVRMLVDTGATAIALSRDDARRAGVGISIGMPNVVGQGASGEVKGEYVTLGRVSLAGTSAENVPAVVLDGGEKSLLGQSFLQKFASVEMSGDRMVLR